MKRVLGLVLLLAVAVSAQAAVDDLPCVLCHPSRDRAAFDVLSEMAGGPVRGESGQAFVCYSCHNGSVVDSRSVLTRGGQHPSGVTLPRPPSKGFPLYGGRLECGTCHSPHGSGAAAKRWLRASDEGTALCSACHAGGTAMQEAHLGKRLSAANLKKIQGLGGKADAGDRIACASCHRLHGAPGPHLLLLPYSPGKEDLCGACHPSAAAQGAEKAPSGHSCSACHSVHGPPSLAQKGDGGKPLCERCHPGRKDRHLGMALSAEQTQAASTLGGQAGPGSKIVCSTCHKVHGASGPRILIAPYGPSTDNLCRTCHPRRSVKGVPAGQKGQPCGDCHRPHSAEPRLFAAEDQTGCKRCHADHADPKSNHKAAAPTCAECHSIHTPSIVEGRRAGLLRSLKQGETLCSGCHANTGKAHGATALAKDVDPALLAARGLALGPKGEVECRTCHTLHAAKESHLLRIPQLLLCLFCHPKENPYGPQGARPGTHPVGVFLKRTQRKVIDSLGLAGPLGTATGQVLECSSCHRAHRNTVSKPACRECHPIQAAGEGHGGTPGCSACHSIHGGGGSNLSCLRCHEKAGTGPHVRNASASGSPVCTSCHDSHGTSWKLLRKPSPGESCFQCHNGKRSLLGGSHDGSRSSQKSPCDPCHPAHGASRAEGADPAGAACAACHPEDLRSLPDHTPAGNPTWKRVSSSLPLFDRKGGRNPFGFLTCPTCHDVHQGKAKNSLRLEANNPPTLCLTCHVDKQTLLGSQHDPRRGGEGAACTACHPVHSRGEAPAAWKLQSDAQGTWNDRKCSPCHGPPTSAPIRHAGQLSHPVNRVIPTEMKPVALPLFDATGGRAGRIIACATCHDLHGREATPGQRFPRFLRKDPASGDLCVSCHPGQGAVAGTPHDVRGRWPAGTGVCGPCHIVHRAYTPGALWGLKPGPGDYTPNARCRSCHTQQGPVRSKVLLLQYHMKDAEDVRSPRGAIYLQYPMTILDEWALKTGKDPVIPLYDKRGAKGPEGSLQCVSCHDPHVWSPMGDFVKPGFGSLGPNVVTHFVRLKDTEPLSRSACAVCHPKDAAEKYRKYHEVWEDLGPGSR